MGAALIQPRRNFLCGQTMKDLSDGQLFWIIKNGSPGIGMMSFVGLPVEEIWQMIQVYIIAGALRVAYTL